MQPNDITFYQRFEADILAGRKTITNPKAILKQAIFYEWGGLKIINTFAPLKY